MLNSTTCPVGFLAHLPSLVNSTTTNATDIEHELAAQLASSVAVAVLLLTASAFSLFVGARLVRPTLFVAAFVSATLSGILVVDALLPAMPELSATASCLVLGLAPLVLGILAGVLAICVLEVGFALLGAGSGAGLGYFAYAAGLSKLPTIDLPSGSGDLTLLLCLLGGALIGSVLICKFRKALLIVATSLLGAAGAVPALLLLLSHAHATAVLAAVGPHGQYFWAPAASLLVLFAAGLVVQCRSARKKQSDHQTHPTFRPSAVPLMRP